MVKKFKFNKEFKGTHIRVQIDDELRIETLNDTECIMDGIFAIFELDSDMAREYGEVVERLW